MNPENDAVEDVTPPVAVITGASSGIGLAAACELARLGWSVELVGRDRQRLDAAADLARSAAATGDRRPGAVPTRIGVHRCDFGVLADVAALAATLRAELPRIDLLANNAGGAFPERRTTVDGFEYTIQVNHLAHVLLSHDLRVSLRNGRIVNTSSIAHRRGRLDPGDLSLDRHRYRMFTTYGSAKQANILFATEAARRWPEIFSASFHPGVVRTRFGAESAVVRMFYRYAPLVRTPQHGARTLVWLAAAEPAALTPGGFYIDERLATPSRRASDPDLAADLWRVSLAAVGRAEIVDDESLPRASVDS